MSVKSGGAVISRACCRLFSAVSAIAILIFAFGVVTSPSASAGTYQSSWKTATSIAVVKSASITSFSAAGTAVTYYYEVTNTGSTTLTSVGVTDPMVGLSAVVCPNSTLAAGASEQCGATYTTTAADVTNGWINNTGTASGTYCSTTVTDSSSLTIPYAAPVGPPATSLSVVKSASVTSFSAAGTAVTYYYEVTNTGSTPLSKVGVTDPMVGLSAVVCPDSSLAAGASEQCSATYTTTAADVTNGWIHNTGTASGTYCSTTVTAMSSLTIPYVAPGGVPTSSIAVVKSASVTSFSAAGTAVTYYYEVTNTGSTTLNSVAVTDPMVGLSAVVCPDSTLAAGASEQCSATYTTTATDVTNGSIHNTGTATGTPSGGTPVTATSSLTIPYVAPGGAPTSSIAVVKSASVTSFSATGTSVTYYYEVTNTGTTSLASVGVTDPMVGLSAIVCSDATLAAGASEQCSATYTTTATDVTNGLIQNTGTATGTPSGGTPVTGTSSLTIPYVAPGSPPTSSIAVVKSASVTSFSASGTAVTYFYGVTNTGSTTLTSVGVTDPMAGLSAVVCPDSTLAAGASEQCSATYTTSAGDVTNGLIHNTGTATGTPSGGTPVTAISSLTIPYVAPVTVVTAAPSSAAPAISLAKTAGSSTYDAAGQVVTYTYVITNTGNVSLASAQYTVTDNLLNGGAAFDCGAPQVLAVGATITCTDTYTITTSDLSKGSVTNLATATNGSQTSPQATATITATTPTTTSVTTTVHTSPSKVPSTKTKTPSGSPSTGGGGAAQLVYNVDLLITGGFLILAGLAAFGFTLRRRRV